MLIDEYRQALAEEKAAKKKVAQLKAKILEEHRPNIEHGTAHFDGFDILIAKKVEWDDEYLEQLKPDWGDFIQASYKVPEAIYKALPDKAKEILDKGRTVKQGTISIKVKDE